MNVNGVLRSTSVERKSSTQKSKEVPTAKEENQSSAAIYEKGDSNTQKASYTQDTATIDRLKADLEKREKQLTDLVKKMLLKQGQTLEGTNIYHLLREGKVNIDPETAKQAQNDISENGYWGVEQTSDRLVSFAKALTGGNPEKADEMIAAIQKGFEAAKKAWGGELPEICKKTIDSAIEKLNAWKSPSAKE
ncbi:MAG: hypothetical protein E6600_16195 [Anaerocolumna aminovalerica]|jgi:hypothetical protein|uniref:hypothetical protein n=1 Tax=Anaerocolumna aminovalerica TaxID=1527 RepID=UPI002915571A|nr:hypothetical protein [Anaerocolumna aminovalerica]MDU6266038.1 hypothetical protein [Anaerocolumna aminovalerica]